MKTVKSNLSILLGQKSQREGRRITLRTVADETKLTRHTVYKIADNTIKEYPKAAIEKLCAYFPCEIHELLSLVDAPDTTD
jgi:DNA-binding Xre family transcriptional regulator